MIDDRPLDALVPGLRAPMGPGRVRMVEASIEGDAAWILALDGDPGGAVGLRRWTAKHLEAALLARLSAPGPRVIGEPTQGFGVAPAAGIHLLLFADVAGDIARAVEPFGLRPSALDGARWHDVQKALDPAPPRATFSARVHTPARTPELHAALVEDTLEPWGLAPGRPADRLLHLAADVLGHPIGADPAGLDAVEALLVDTTPGVIRWMPPLLFQALADLMGVVAQQALGAKVAWAECAPEPDGYVPPPLLRLETKRNAGPVHLPIGQHLVAWCVMPLAPGEAPPPLSAWLAHEVA